MARFARIGVGAGKTFDASRLTSEMMAAIKSGRKLRQPLEDKER